MRHKKQLLRSHVDGSQASTAGHSGRRQLLDSVTVLTLHKMSVAEDDDVGRSKKYIL